MPGRELDSEVSLVLQPPVAHLAGDADLSLCLPSHIPLVCELVSSRETVCPEPGKPCLVGNSPPDLLC